MRYLSFLLLLFFCCSCLDQSGTQPETSSNLIEFVDPFIGTKNMGHTFPGATAPFGMVQLSPETNQQEMFVDGQYNKPTYRYCSGYQYEDSTIFGFSHTHFSGTGHSDLGDFLIMPASGELQLNPGKADGSENGYHSLFSKESEKAEPGYYRVRLSENDILAEMTASERVGFHRYTFSKKEDAHLILDLMSNIYHHEDKNVWTFIRVENDSVVTGWRQTNGWARTRKMFFAMQLSKPFSTYGHKKYDKAVYNGFYRKFNEEENFPEMAGKNLRAYFSFPVEAGEQVMLKFALSAVSTDGALKNLEAEVPHWDFEQTKAETQKKWNDELNKIEIDVLRPEQKVTFYTALYHTMLSPVLYEDVDGKYRGLDQNIHESEGFQNYTIFSLWDTYRALHPLFNLTQTQRNNDMIKSMLAHHDQSVHQMLPVWSHYSNENWCMIGYHSVSVIADAIAKGTTDVDLKRALLAAQNTSNVKYFDGLDTYIQNGYVAEDKSPYSVSKTLEYAYNDWCIAQIAARVNEAKVHETYINRSQNFRNVFHGPSGYMRPKLSSGEWREEFNPLDTHGQGFIEGNAWNYGLYVPHDVDSMIAMMGGKDHFSSHLDKIFSTPIADEFIEQNEDITRDGIIGNYVHGNEPGHHIPYLYNWTNHPYKTQERVRMIMDSMYSHDTDGLCGNDDAGQMSAWYVFSALGFYPVLPGSATYAIGSPLVKSATVNLENGHKIHVKVTNQSDNNVYVQKVLLNGLELEGLELGHQDLANGATVEFLMSEQP